MTQTEQLAAERKALVDAATFRWGEADDRKWSDLENQCHVLQESLALEIDDDHALAAFGVIEHIGAAFETEDSERAVDHLGKAMVCAAMFAYAAGLAIAPVFDLARVFTARQDVHPVHGVGRLAAVARQDRPQDAAVVEALAMCIAKGLDDCEIVHQLKIAPLELFLVVGREALAAADKQRKIEMLDADLKAGKIKLPPGWTHHPLPQQPDDRVDAMAYAMESANWVPRRGSDSDDELRERIKASLHVDMAAPDSDLTTLISPRGICPQCAAPMFPLVQMSPLDGTGYRCINGHELTSEQMNALTGEPAKTAGNSDP